jgi:hypothetical protein
VADGVFKLRCPCCGAALEIDAEAQTLLTHQAPKREMVPADLREAVKKLKSEESTRDERFQKQVQAEREHERTLEKRFDGLLKKARSEGPPARTLRDIDLD